MRILGTHLLIDLWACNSENMDDRKRLERIMVRAAENAGATVVSTSFQDFKPHGISGVVVIAESHLTIHTWPEHGYAAVDVFTCGDTVDPWKAVEFLKTELGSQESRIRDFRRGVPDPGAEEAV